MRRRMGYPQTCKWLLLALPMVLFWVACSKKDNVVVPSPPVTPAPPLVTIAPPPDLGFVVVGYFPSYRDPAQVPDQKFRMCNIVNYAFANVASTGSLTVLNPAVLRTVAAKAKANNAKIFISLGGQALDFRNMAASLASRTAFIREVMALVRTEGLQGVDVDWEFPRTDDGSDQLYLAFMQQLSDSLHTNRQFYLSTAISSGKFPGAIRDAIPSILWTSQKVDFFNIMSYDDFSTTQAYQQHSPLSLSQTSLNYWVNTRGMPASKAVLGVPAYGRASGMTQTGTTMGFAAIVAAGGSAVSDSAVVSQGSFLNYKIYYNGLPTIKQKAMLARQQAGGVMMWEKGQDRIDANSLLKAICDTLGRTY
jgi:chitinase